MKLQFSSSVFLVVAVVLLLSQSSFATPAAKSHLSKLQQSTSTREIRSKMQSEKYYVDVTAASSKEVKSSEGNQNQSQKALKLFIGVAGIYAAFLYYGTLQEDVFHFVGAGGAKFKEVWFLQAIEALANVIVGGIGLMVFGATAGLPQDLFAWAGLAQVSAKACNSLALANGLSFPVATLAKSGKMVPVMIGSLLLSNAKYTLKQYLNVAAIIAGTIIVSGGKSKKAEADSPLGIAFILGSLACDACSAGMQERMKMKSKEIKLEPKPYDMMFWTNLYMALVAAAVALFQGELFRGIKFCQDNPDILKMIMKFGLCSAIGQTFIFFTISNFDSLTTATVTTTRKVFSVLLSIFLNGHKLEPMGWFGLALASGGILSELKKEEKHTEKTSDKDKKKN